MTPENFCYWLQGYIELSNCQNLTPEQIQMIRDHLQLVFKKETPSYPMHPLAVPLKQNWGVFRDDATSVLCAQNPNTMPSC